MRRSRLTGQPKSKDTEFGWYFAGKPMTKRYSRSGQIRLVRYGPEMETCAHSRCPSPSPNPEKGSCSCNSHCELHCELYSSRTRSPSPSTSEASVFDPPKTCCGGCHAIKRDPEPSPQAEKAHCTCNSRCQVHSNEPRQFTPASSEFSDSEFSTKCWGSCHHMRHEHRMTDTRPTTPNSSGLSDQEPVRRRRSGHRTSKREQVHAPHAAHCQCKAAASPNAPAASSPRLAPRTSSAPAPRPVSMGTPHHCRKASYCESHPDTCRATVGAPFPRPRSMPTPAQCSRLSEGRVGEKPRPSTRTRSTQPECTCRPSPSFSKQTPSTTPMFSSKSASPRLDGQHCSCHMDGYYADDPGYCTPYDEDTASETSNQAVAPENCFKVDESRCVFYHRCCPRFECGVGWVCGRQ